MLYVKAALKAWELNKVSAGIGEKLVNKLSKFRTKGVEEDGRC